MKQLCEKLQNEFRDIVICTVSPILPCVQIVPTLERGYRYSIEDTIVSESRKVCIISIYL